MKRLYLLLILVFASCLLQARNTEGYYISKKGDTVHVTFQIQYDLFGRINWKEINQIIRYKNTGSNQVERLGPGQVRLVVLHDSSLGEILIAPLHYEKTWLFAQCLVKGDISVFQTEGINWAWILNKYSSPTSVTNYVQAKGKPLAISNITPFTNRFWFDYLGKEYAEYTSCLVWNAKTRRAKRKQGITCEIKNVGFLRVAEIINNKINSKYENTYDLPR
jgi:hypothetical protein